MLFACLVPMSAAWSITTLRTAVPCRVPMCTMESAEAPEERRPPSVYQLMSEDEVASVHDVADALFNIVDRNGDEEISQEDLGSHLLLASYAEENIEALFDLIDVNSDGSVSRTELREAFVRYPPLREAPAMGTLAADDGRTAVHEEADDTFSSLDLDGNGLLSLPELEAHLMGVEGPTYSATAVANIFRTLASEGEDEITRSQFRGGYVRYRAMRIALGFRFRRNVLHSAEKDMA